MNQLNTCPQLTPPALITPTLTLTSLLAAHTWSTTLLLGFTTREASRPHTGRVSRARHHSHHTPHRPCTVTTIPQQQQLIVAFEVSLIGYYYLAHGIYCITTCYSYCYSFKKNCFDLQFEHNYIINKNAHITCKTSCTRWPVVGGCNDASSYIRVSLHIAGRLLCRPASALPVTHIYIIIVLCLYFRAIMRLYAVSLVHSGTLRSKQ